jgi:flavin-binding protein dodecin
MTRSKGEIMGNGVYKGITIAGTSNQSFSHAIEIAVQRAQQTLRELRWFEVREQRGAIRDGQIEYQVEIEVFFKLQPGDDAGS